MKACAIISCVCVIVAFAGDLYGVHAYKGQKGEFNPPNESDGYAARTWTGMKDVFQYLWNDNESALNTMVEDDQAIPVAPGTSFTVQSYRESYLEVELDSGNYCGTVVWIPDAWASFADSATTRPMDDTPMDDTPMDDTPMDDTPMDDTPMDDTPMDDTPMDDTPMDDTPMDDTQME